MGVSGAPTFRLQLDLDFSSTWPDIFALFIWFWKKALTTSITRLGVPTFEKKLSDLALFCTRSPHSARLQAKWAELACQEGLSDQKIKKGAFISIEKLSF